MGTEIQKTNQETSLISRQNWQEKWHLIPVKSDTPASILLTLNTPQLCQMGKDSDNEMVGITIFQAQIISIVEFFGAKWSKDQVLECGQLAYDEYYWFTLAELKQFAIRVKTGRYSSNKNLIPGVLMEFLKEYSEEMHEARGIILGQQKQSTWQPPETPVSDDTVARTLNDLTRLFQQSAQEYEQTENELQRKRMELRKEERKKLDDAKKEALASVQELDPRIAKALKTKFRQ